MFIKRMHILACMLFFSTRTTNWDKQFKLKKWNPDIIRPEISGYYWPPQMRKLLPREMRIGFLQKDVKEIECKRRKYGYDWGDCEKDRHNFSKPMLAYDDFKRMLATSDQEMEAALKVANDKIGLIASILGLN